MTGYSARKTLEPGKVRALRVSRFREFEPSGKTYDDILNRMKWRSSYFFSAMREVAAIVVYEAKGLI